MRAPFWTLNTRFPDVEPQKKTKKLVSGLRTKSQRVNSNLKDLAEFFFFSYPFVFVRQTEENCSVFLRDRLLTSVPLLSFGVSYQLVSKDNVQVIKKKTQRLSFYCNALICFIITCKLTTRFLYRSITARQSDELKSFLSGLRFRAFSSVPNN